MKCSKRLLAALIVLTMLISILPTGAVSANAAVTQENGQVKIGAEVLLESAEWKEYLSGKSVALYTNQVCVDSDMNHLADLLADDPDIKLVCTFGGEHGLRGNYQAGAAVPHAVDPGTGIYAWSLYSGGTINAANLGIAAIQDTEINAKYPKTVGTNLNPSIGANSRPSVLMLEGNNGEWYDPIDVILFDLQEIGSKTWTYMYNLADLMAACVEAKEVLGLDIELIVLDRPSPISSDVVEGTTTAATSSNVAGTDRFPLPSRYGLTMGELALLYQGEGYKHYWSTTWLGGTANAFGSSTAPPADWNWKWDPLYPTVNPNMEKKINLGDCKVKVIPCEGYTRDMYWDETGLQFILPSPNMPTWEAALIYTGTVWLEGRTINEGRGTTKSFELVTANYIDPLLLADRMNALGLEGVTFRASTAHLAIAGQTGSGADSLANGVQYHITDKRAFSPIEATVALFLMTKTMYPSDFNASASATLTGVSWIGTEMNGFKSGATNKEVLDATAAILARMEEESEDYRLNVRPKYLMSEYDTPAQKELRNTPTANITLGYENLLSNLTNVGGFNLKTAKVGLVANSSSVDKDYNHLADVLMEAGVNLTTLFGDGLGMRHEFKTAASGTYTDGQWLKGNSSSVAGTVENSAYGTGLPVYRLNTGDVPSAAQLADVDVLLFDMQDSGTRSNSNVNMMADCMKACAENGVTFIVLDRPNPLGGDAVEGPVNELEGAYPISTRYGMTLGELALMIKGEFGYYEDGSSLEDLDLIVIPMEDWTRDMTYEDTGLQYIMTDRKIATTTANLTYAALSWLDGTGAYNNSNSAANPVQKGFSSGWGTTKSYEFFGAPFVASKMNEFVEALNAANLPGVRFRVAAMTPWAATANSGVAAVKYFNVACYGAQLHVYDPHEFDSVGTALTILTEAKKLFSSNVAEMFTTEFNEIVGNTWIAGMIKNGSSVAEIKAMFQDDVDEFIELRKDYLLYGVEKGDDKYDIIVTGTKPGNGQCNINFPIRSANGKGYTVYISEIGPSGPFKVANANFNSSGAHVKGLTNGVKYYAYVEYSSGGIYERSDVVILLPSK